MYRRDDVWETRCTSSLDVGIKLQCGTYREVEQSEKNEVKDGIVHDSDKKLEAAPAIDYIESTTYDYVFRFVSNDVVRLVRK